MSNITGALYKIRYLDEFSRKKTLMHRLSPTIKLIVTLIYILLVVSFGKYQLGGVIAMSAYPLIMLSLAEMPAKELIKRVVVAMPFVMGVGIFNPVFDRDIMTYFLGIGISGGWISFLTLIVKGVLTVSSAIILVGTTGIENIAHSMRILKMPKIFVVLILLTYRYISVLMEEAASIWTAYKLRAPGQKGIRHDVWGPLLGQLLLRTYDRGIRVYDAMILRGFDGDFRMGTAFVTGIGSYLFLLIALAGFLIIRLSVITMILDLLI
ncbi:cobalt ECF transporter T component CbiQ [Alkalibacter mobilis]|uniref:cobalt ECF transporter T component CbiQ n=1 Tax=Alkalibacter mobilis TaxID=2787712 RepID=UPI0018A0A762|nr:cobalt ECF transporter T component CbiQ [Alkalibacter mobilis]MBF7096394.1 cobalt ECF transporter T component CbiQ [Alkalibacter mobilis]